MPSQHLVHRPFIAVHGVHHKVQDRIQQFPGCFRIEALDQLHRALGVGKEHRDLLTLTFEGGASGADLVGKMLRDMRQQHTLLVCSWGCGGRGA